MTDIVIVSAARTPVGSFLGALSSVSAVDLGVVAVKEALNRASVQAEEIDELIMGHVLTAGLGQNTARQTAIKAGFKDSSTAFTLNQVCGSGLRAVALGMQQILSGDAKIVVAGGQESMSLAPHALTLRTSTKMGNAPMVDTMIQDGLWDAFNNFHMGTTAENIAKEFNISREDQDKFAVGSQNKAEAAQKVGKFAEEIAPVVISGRKGDVTVDMDEYIRHGSTLDGMAKLKPAFSKDGTVTAGNASGLNDGAAAVVLMTASEAQKRGLKPLARIVSWATAGVDPKIMGMGPVAASKKALEKAGWTLGDLDVIESNEAFAAQSLAVSQQMGWDMAKVNVNGGAIAIGHPIGASGCRVLVSLLHEIKRSNKKKGIATLCIGGGMGVAMCVEAV